METTESQVRSSQPIKKHTVAGEVARANAQVCYSDVVASMETLEQELWVVRQRFGDVVHNLWKTDTHGVHPEDLSEDSQ